MKPKQSAPLYVGTAAWTIPSQSKNDFPAEGTHLQRYSRVFNAVEINSSFYRDHKPETYAKWAGSTPDHFRFSVKLSRYFTQEMRLKESGERLRETLDGVSHLGDKLSVILVQLPPSLEFNRADVSRFISALQKSYDGDIAWEPRHLSWTSDAAVRLLSDHGIAKVVADPERCPWTPEQMERSKGFAYYRLHGSPEIYKSQYSSEYVAEIASELERFTEAERPAWCIFDNTSFGYATEDALELSQLARAGTLSMKRAG